MKSYALVCVALVAAQTSACAIRPTGDLNAFAERSSHASFEVFNRSVDAPNTLVLAVDFDRQTEGPACGAHAMASLVNYWRKSHALDGSTLFRKRPPKAPSGYSMDELLSIAAAHGLSSSAVRIDEKSVIAELEKGRPVLVPVRLPSIYVQQRTIPVGDVPVIGTARNLLMARSGKVSELTGMAMVNHYLLVIGYGQSKGETRFVVLDPVMGYRTISADKLERYRKAFGDAAIVSAATAPTRRAKRPMG
ncbi:MAG: papain-like cysteine protease family protein [Alphaproteobacteria bacterium]